MGRRRRARTEILKKKSENKNQKIQPTKYVGGMSFPGNWFELIMSPSILPIIVPGMLHHLRDKKKIELNYIIKLLYTNTIFYSLFQTSSFTAIPAY